MRFQDGRKPVSLSLGLRAMMDQHTLERRIRGGSRHAQQRVSKLRFDARQFLQFCQVHVLEIGDLHKKALPFVQDAPSKVCEEENRKNVSRAAAFPFPLFRIRSTTSRTLQFRWARISSNHVVEVSPQLNVRENAHRAEQRIARWASVLIKPVPPVGWTAWRLVESAAQ